MGTRDLALWSRVATYYDMRDRMRDINIARIAAAEGTAYTEEMNRLQTEMDIMEGKTTREAIYEQNWDFLRMVQNGVL